MAASGTCSRGHWASSLSPHATPFFMAKRLAGRSKALRWDMDSYAGSDDDDYESSATPSTYLDAARRALRAMTMDASAAPDGGEIPSGGPAMDIRPAGSMRRRRRSRRAKAKGDLGQPAVQPPQPLSTAQGPARQHPVAKTIARVPVHQRLGPRRAEWVPAHQRFDA